MHWTVLRFYGSSGEKARALDRVRASSRTVYIGEQEHQCSYCNRAEVMTTAVMDSYWEQYLDRYPQDFTVSIKPCHNSLVSLGVRTYS